jgi:hypothetical protein
LGVLGPWRYFNPLKIFHSIGSVAIHLQRLSLSSFWVSGPGKKFFGNLVKKEEGGKKSKRLKTLLPIFIGQPGERVEVPQLGVWREKLDCLIPLPTEGKGGIWVIKGRIVEKS